MDAWESEHATNRGAGTSHDVVPPGLAPRVDERDESDAIARDVRGTRGLRRSKIRTTHRCRPWYTPSSSAPEAQGWLDIQRLLVVDTSRHYWRSVR